MKTFIPSVLTSFVYSCAKNASICETCKNCQHLDLNNSITYEEYISRDCLEEEKYYYCRKQNRYISIFSTRCNDYIRN